MIAVNVIPWAHSLFSPCFYLSSSFFFLFLNADISTLGKDKLKSYHRLEAHWFASQIAVVELTSPSGTFNTRRIILNWNLR